MQTRSIGPLEVSAVSLGCMNLSHAYGVPPSPEAGAAVLRRALELGYIHLDTAALYGMGANETLIGDTLADRRGEFTLASKCALGHGEAGRAIDGRPETIARMCDESLARLRTDVIDLYYLHRLDPAVPIEDSVGALARLLEQGKVRSIGLSEVSAATLRRAHAVHPIAALQTEYSLWTRNAEVAVLDACRELGVAFVAFSPVTRGFLPGEVTDIEALPPKDIRRFMPRFQGEAFQHNLTLLEPFAAEARAVGCTPAQLCLAWLLAKDPIIVPIPGTTQLGHLQDNAQAADIVLDAAAMARVEALINPQTVAGPRYSASVQAQIDTEELP